VHPEQLLQARYRQLQHFVAVRSIGMLDAVSDLVMPSTGGSDLGEIGGSVQLDWLSVLGAIAGGSQHVETARPSDGSGGGPVGHVRSLIDNIRPIGGLGGGSGYVTSTVSGTQQKVLFEQFPLLLLFIPRVCIEKDWAVVDSFFCFCFLIEFQFGSHLILKPLKTVVEPLIAALEYEDICVRLVEPRRLRGRNVPHDWRGFPQDPQRLVRIHHLLVVCIHRPLSCHRYRSA
jgi:hypothetical protein